MVDTWLSDTQMMIYSKCVSAARGNLRVSDSGLKMEIKFRLSFPFCDAVAADKVTGRVVLMSARCMVGTYNLRRGIDDIGKVAT